MIPTLDEMQEAEKPLVSEQIRYSEETLSAFKIRFDKKYKKDHSLEDVERMVKIGIDFTRTDKEITKENPMHFGQMEELF